MKYAHLEESTNKILGWYDKEINLFIPEPNIEVTNDIWLEAISINANCFENGEFIVKDLRTKEEIAIQEITNKIQEAKAYLVSTDFYMTVDKYATLTADKQLELTTKRAEARELINTLEAELNILEGAK